MFSFIFPRVVLLNWLAQVVRFINFTLTRLVKGMKPIPELNIRWPVAFFLLLVIGSDVKALINKAHKPKKFDVIFHFRFMTSRVAMTKTKWSILYVLRYSDTYFALFPEISESMGKLSGLQGVLRLVSRSYRIPRRFSTKFAHLCTCVGKNDANKTRKINRAFDRTWDK